MNILNLLTNKLFMLALGIVMVVAGQLLNCKVLFYPGAVITLSIVFIFFLFAWMLNPICLWYGKTILKGFRRPLAQIPFCIPRYIKTKKRESKTVMFDSSIFTKETHINKIFGFTVGGMFEKSIHKNSFRFGWRIVDEKIEIMSYVYIDGHREYKLLAKILPNVHYELILQRNRREVVFEVFQGRTSIATKVYDFKNSHDYGYRCGLYYGGKPKAPHTIKIKVW